jgi:hypothetical protein
VLLRERSQPALELVVAALRRPKGMGGSLGLVNHAELFEAFLRQLEYLTEFEGTGGRMFDDENALLQHLFKVKDDQAPLPALTIQFAHGLRPAEDKP